MAYQKKSPTQLQREIDVALASKQSKQRTACANCGGKGRTTGCRNCGVMSGRRSEIRHLKKPTTSSAVPSIGKWSTAAGGTAAAAGKYGYTFAAPEGTYHVWPVSSKSGRHIGYALKFSATGGRPKGSHGGLWHELGTHRSPQSAIKAAKQHHALGFE